MPPFGHSSLDTTFGVGGCQFAEVSVDSQAQSAARGDLSSPLPADREFVPVRSQVPVDTENLGDGAKVER